MGRSKVAGKVLARGRPPVEMAILSMVFKWLVLWFAKVGSGSPRCKTSAQKIVLWCSRCRRCFGCGCFVTDLFQ